MGNGRGKRVPRCFFPHGLEKKTVEWTEYIKFFAGLLSIVNPIGSIPIFINLTANQSGVDRRRTGSVAALTVALVLGLALLMGEAMLRFFGITISSFRVGGGLLILLMSISMMHARLSPVKQTEEEAKDAAERDSVAVVPLGIPLLAGPGAISTVIVYAHYESSFVHYSIIGAEICLVGLVVWISFRLAPMIASALGKTGINVVTRIMGLVMAAIGIEFMAIGLRQLFPGLS
jgi:multiple antibiotic resistance protein